MDTQQIQLIRRLEELLGGTYVSQSVGVLAHLAVPDILAEGPASVEEIAERAGAHAPSLRRLLRFCSDLGVVALEADGRYAATPLCGLLTTGPHTLRGLAMMVSSPFHRDPWTHLRETVETGTPAIETVLGADLFGYLAGHPDDSEIFQAGMSVVSGMMLAAFVPACDFSGSSKVVDVGAGEGALLEAVLRANPHLTGVLFDTPSVVEAARERMAQVGLAERCGFVQGDFFEGVPAGGDTYILSNIVHDFEDETALRVLSSVRSSVETGTRLLIVEAVLPDDATPSVATLVDMDLLVATRGRQRTASEFRALLPRAGFAVSEIVVGSETSPASYVDAVAD